MNTPINLESWPKLAGYSLQATPNNFTNDVGVFGLHRVECAQQRGMTFTWDEVANAQNDLPFGIFGSNRRKKLRISTL
jgi:hypothetical protein